MPRVYVDAGVSLDGFWAGPDETSVFPVDEMHRSGLMKPLVERTGAVVMSRRSFEMAEDPDWYACNYEYQVPIHVFTDATPSRKPKQDCGLTFAFHATFDEALEAAKEAAGAKDVAIIGEQSAVEAAIAGDHCDEIFLRLVPVVCGGGERLMDESGIRRSFEIVDVLRTGSVVHMRLQPVKDEDAAGS